VAKAANSAQRKCVIWSQDFLLSRQGLLDMCSDSGWML
jgi:hypothetical protein